MGLFDFLESSFLSSCPLSDLGLLKILSQSVGGLFVLLMVSFALQKLCNFMRFHLSILGLTAQAIPVLFRNFPPVPISSRFFPTFSSISFSVAGFMWSSLIHLDLTLVQGDRSGSISNLLHDTRQLCQHHFLKMLSFFHWMVLAPLSKIKYHRCVGSFLSFKYLLCVCVKYYMTIKLLNPPSILKNSSSNY